jgi:cyclophilin family peptidyl-prolyl cis-trans isomerase
MVMKKGILTALLVVLCITSTTFGNDPNRPKVILQTTFGDIGLELYADEAPVTVENFLMYVNSGFYDGLLFHRIIPDFMIQGGSHYYANGRPYEKQTSTPIENESYNGLSNLRGTIAMARYSIPDSATSSFFINLVDNTFLDRAEAADGYGYCVFGHVISGMDVVDEIAQTPTQRISSSFQNFPYPEIVYIEKASKAPAGYWIAGDINNDGIVDFTDFAILASSFVLESEDPSGYLDGDLEINAQDIALLAHNWLQTTDWYE